MKHFFVFVLLICISMGLSAQVLRPESKVFHLGDRIPHQQPANKQTANCGTDTIRYAQLKASLADSLIRFLRIGTVGPTVGQRFEVPTGGTVHVSGSGFWAYSNAADGSGFDVCCSIYLTDPTTGFPTGTPIASDTLSINGAPNTPNDIINYADFGTTVSMVEDYVITVENLSDSIMFMGCNNWAVDAGKGESLAYLNFYKQWKPTYLIFSLTDNLDMDWVIEPIVSYDISAGFTSDATDCLVYDSTYTFTSNNSPLLSSRFYNLIAFNAFFNAASDSSITWNFGDGSPQEVGAEVPHAFPAGSSTYTVNSYVTMIGYSQICVDSAEITYDAAAIPVSDFAPTIATANLTVAFTDSSTDAEFYSWDFGDGNTATDENPVHTYATFGTYTVCQIVLNSCGADTSCTSVQLICPALTPSWSATSNQLIASFTDASTTNGTVSFFWDFGDGNSSTTQSPSHTYSEAGTYTVCLTMTDDCGSDFTCRSLTVNCPAPVAGFETQYLGNLVYNFADTSNTANVIASYLWDFGDGTTSTLQSPSHTYATAGNYTICLTATDDCGADSACASVSLSTGISNEFANAIKVFPNPNQGQFTLILDLSQAMDLEITVVDLLGKELQNLQFSQVLRKELQINLSDLGSGIYLLRVVSQRETFIQRIELIK